VIGPFIGGALADTIGYRAVFFLTAGLCTITGIIIMVYVEEAKKERSASKHTISIWSNVKFIRQSPPLRLAVVLILLSQSSVFLVQPVFALFIDSMITTTEYVATVAGAIFSVAGIFTVVSAPWWGRRNDEKSMRKNLSIAFGGAAVAYVLHFFVSHPIPLIILRAMLGFCLGGMLPSLLSYVSKHTTIPRRGGILGLATSSNTLAHLIGAPLGGLIGAQIGIRSVFLFAGIFLMTSVWTVRTFFEDITDHKSTTD
jgi:DHA1 family multidrug resistance protein-like MFS transporter